LFTLLATAVFSLAAPVLASHYLVQWSPWILGLFLFGLPHGARDLYVWHRLKPQARPVKFVASYVLAGLAVFLAWRLSPPLALYGFLGISAVHFGASDLTWSNLRLRSATYPMIYSVAHLVIRSLLPLTISAARWPEEFGTVVSGLLGSAGLQGSIASGPSTVPSIFLSVAALFLIPSLLCVPFSASARHPASKGVANDQLESLVLVFLFWVAPPVLAIGVYFVFWHSQRHVARLAHMEFPDSSGYWPAIWRFHVRSAPLTAFAILGMGGLWLLVAGLPDTINAAGAIFLIVVSALTVPHFWVITNLDWRAMVR
jgi:Brp/Blh family beta-carotene 15,15'-monooxygenase